MNIVTFVYLKQQLHICSPLRTTLLPSAWNRLFSKRTFDVLLISLFLGAGCQSRPLANLLCYKMSDTPPQAEVQYHPYQLMMSQIIHALCCAIGHEFQPNYTCVEASTHRWQCAFFRETITHMRSCHLPPRTCEFRNCQVYTYLIIHWRNCANRDCRLCKIVIESRQRRGPCCSSTVPHGPYPVTERANAFLAVARFFHRRTPCTHQNNTTENQEENDRHQIQLIRLLHAFECMMRQQRQPRNHSCCGNGMNLVECPRFRAAVFHLAECPLALGFCTVPDCDLNYILWTHYQRCTRQTCNICEPLRRNRQQDIQDIQALETGTRESGSRLSDLAEVCARLRPQQPE